MNEAREKSEPLALDEWREATRWLHGALRHAEHAVELHPSPLPRRWVGAIPRLKSLLDAFAP